MRSEILDSEHLTHFYFYNYWAEVDAVYYIECNLFIVQFEYGITQRVQAAEGPGQEVGRPDRT